MTAATDNHQYRHELKYYCTQGQLAILEARIAPLMRRDKHQDRAEGYYVRSLYFDDLSDHYLKSNLIGLNERVKFRIRCYGRTDRTLHMEAKYKLHGLSRKESFPLTREACQALIDGGTLPLDIHAPSLMRRLFIEQQTHFLKPRIVVDYLRTAYTERAGNVRVTFDRNIAFSDNTAAFLNPALALTPLLPHGRHILEVKYDQFIPEHLLQIMEIGTLTQCTFSKYAMSRQWPML